MVLYCGGGGRSALAAKSLAEMGYEKVENLAGRLARLGRTRDCRLSRPDRHPPKLSEGHGRFVRVTPSPP